MAHKIMRLVVLFLIPLGSYSQLHKTLNIGDSIPPMTFRNIFNKPGTTLSINSFRGKLIILDFWNVWCGSCIEAFPKMEKLQQQFGDKIKVLLVTNNDDEEIKRLFTKIKSPGLTIISGDSVLNNSFPHNTVPHHVWINPDGRVQFITDGYNATEANITKVLKGENFNLHVKNEAADFEIDSSLWKEGNGRLQKYITGYSYGMRKVEEYGGGMMSFIKDTINKTSGFKFVNISLCDLYKIAFGGSFNTSEFYYNNRILYRIPGGDKRFKYPSYPDSILNWEKENVICYESRWKLENDTLAYQYLQHDVNRLFPYSVKAENAEVMCYSLSCLDNSAPVITSGEDKIFEYTDTSFCMKNMPVSALVGTLNGLDLFKSTPVVDDTYLTKNIDVVIRNAFTNIAELKIQLLKNGFALQPGRKKIKMLVIGNKK